jgi:hypothetical protein
MYLCVAMYGNAMHVLTLFFFGCDISLSQNADM